MMLVGAASAASAAELSDATVEKILGIAGVHHGPAQFLRTDTSYRNAAGTLLFDLRKSVPSDYDIWKSLGGNRIEAVPDVAQEAFTNTRLGGLCARSGTSAVCVSPVPLPGSPVITRSQQIELVRAAL